MTTTAPSVPTSTSQRAAGTAVAIAAFIAYFVGLHVLVVGGSMPSLALAVSLAPWAVALFTTLLGTSRSPTSQRVRRVAACVAAVSITVVAWRHGDLLARHAGALVCVENVAFLALLSLTFAVTLRSGAEPLITRLARAVRGGDMPPSVIRYTRHVTVAWALFFAIAAAVSTGLYVVASRAVWSTFANLLMWPLVAAMFAGEYLIRLRVLRDVRHGSMLRGVSAFRHRAGLRDAEGPSS